MILNELILKAQIFALKAHRHQKYGGNVPYSVHLFHVAEIAMHFLYLLPNGEDKINAIIAAWLHDCLEDTGMSYNDIKKIFGEKIADIVFGVTNEQGKNRTEKAALTYPKTAKNRISVYDKLADRIANTRYSKTNKHRMFEQYKEEYDHFKQVLFIPGEYDDMWNYLELLMKNE